MKRIVIIGCCGAGKSTFSFKLAEKTGLPLIHLDTEYFLPLWVPRTEDDWNQKVTNLISGDEWIIEGNYAGSLDKRLSRADTVIFFDYPLFKCLFRVFKRIITMHGQVRPDVAAGCPERLDFDFIAYVLSFNKAIQPKIDKALLQHPEVNQIVFKKDKDAEKFLQSL